MIHHIPRRLMLGNGGRRSGFSCAGFDDLQGGLRDYRAIRPRQRRQETPRYGVKLRSAQTVSKYRRRDFAPRNVRFRRSFGGVLPPMGFVTSEKSPLKPANHGMKLFSALNAPTKALKNARIGRPFSKGIAQ
jgi:hypothetical protein